MDDLWPEILKVLPAGQVLFTGHSLGGGRAQLSKAKIRSAEVVTFGAICCAIVRSGRQPTAPSRSRGSSMRTTLRRTGALVFSKIGASPGPMAWLHDGTMHEASERPGMLISILDPACVAAHSIDTGYIAALVKLPSAGNQRARPDPPHKEPP